MMIRSVRLTENDRKNVEKGSLDDHYLCTDIDRMEKNCAAGSVVGDQASGMGM